MDTPTTTPNRNCRYIGIQYYALTWSCYAQQPYFAQRDRVELVREQLLRASRETNVADIAHCYMRDHLHQIVKGETGDADAALYIRKAKQYSGFYFKDAFQMKLWVRKGFDQLLRDEYEYRTALKYLIENPVKAGLVARIEDYPFTGSSRYSIKQLMEIAGCE